VGREGGTWEDKWTGWREWGGGEPDLVLRKGKRTEALRASRKNGNRHSQEIGGWGGGGGRGGGGAPECTRDMRGERLPVLNGRDLR
jgi:hypothetical protein